MNFLEVTAYSIGCKVAEILNANNEFGLVAEQIEKDGKMLYVAGEKEVKPTDTQRYTAFHVMHTMYPSQRTENAFIKATNARLRGASETAPLNVSANASFVLFGFLDAKDDHVFKIISAFQGQRYFVNQGDFELSADIQFNKIEFSPNKIVKKYFAGDWPKIQHVQQRLTSLEIEYTANILTCKYCLDGV